MRTSIDELHPLDLRTRHRLDRPSSRKWSLHPGTIGAWVAEMDFGTAPAVTEALHRAVDDEVFGYLSPAVAAELGEATSGWLADEHGWDVDPARVHPVSDVMAALGVAVQEFTEPGSAVIVPTPAYMPFLTYLPGLGHPVIEVPGAVDTDGRWSHDLDGIDRAFRAGARTLVLCNPHNPTGSVLDRGELEAIAEVVSRHGGRVFADEIHAPLRYDREHIPYASLSAETAAHTITGTSASKAWNIPGLKAAQLITSNDEDERAYSRFGFAVVHGASTLGVIASTAAYRDGREWLGDTMGYLDGSRRLLDELVATHLPGARLRRPDATYIGWIDVCRLGLGARPAEFFRQHAGVTLTEGALCGAGFDDHVRLVFATPRPILEEALTSMGRAVQQRTGGQDTGGEHAVSTRGEHA
ncbi:MalY/PatB family protein [Cnuibacter sp. UC19_7]|uniref:MalY/PatB family protein n=1 Tax=Cnuibacter sp. UC19_7 TaxID=3350166 RepID=UPI00366EF719